MRRSWLVARGTSTALLLALACIDAPTAPTVAPPVRVQDAWVTGEALAAVDAGTGLFHLAPPAPLVMGEAEATALAAAVTGFLSGPALTGTLVSSAQQQRGDVIELLSLRSCGRATYSESALGPIPPAVPGWARRSIGSHWAIPFCGGNGAAQLSVGIPDNPADLRIVDGRLVFRQFGGGADFDLTGVPARFPTGLPLTPEEAVQAVFARLGVRVRTVPSAVNQLDGGFTGSLPLCASWRLRTEHPVTVHRLGSSAAVSVDELYVRHVPACYSDSTAFYIPSTTQPASIWIPFNKDTTGLAAVLGIDSAEVRFVRPSRFDRVVP